MGVDERSSPRLRSAANVDMHGFEPGERASARRLGPEAWKTERCSPSGWDHLVTAPQATTPAAEMHGDDLYY